MRKRKIKRRISYREELYENLSLNHLIIFGIYSVVSKKEKCTFEKLIEECFTLFPKAFSLNRHSEWPDSLKFARPLRKLREKGLIVGSSKTFFSLTKFGESIAKDTTKILKIGLPKKISIGKAGRDAEINWIRTIKKSETFQRFLKEKKHFSITDMELRNLLYCTLETPLRIVKQNLAYSINLAKEFQEKTLLEFLKLCQRKLTKK